MIASFFLPIQRRKLFASNIIFVYGWPHYFAIFFSHRQSACAVCAWFIISTEQIHFSFEREKKKKPSGDENSENYIQQCCTFPRGAARSEFILQHCL